MSDEKPEDYELIKEMRRQTALTHAKLAEYNNVVRFSASGQKTNGELVLRPARLPEPGTLEPRKWLYGTQLVRGAVTVLVAPGGTGKSAYAMAVGIALAAKRNLLGEFIFERVNTAIFNLDDPMDELERRVAATMIAHKIRRDELEGRLFLEDCDGHRLCIAAQDKDETGFFIANPDEKNLTELVRKHDIGILVIDPFAESHALEENSNPHMVQAAAAWRRIARNTNCAVLLVHHVRKGDAAGSIEAARGAKALTDSARAALLMTVMSAEEAQQFNIHDDDRAAYVRLDDVKRNMAPATKAKWFKLQSVSLGNKHNPAYPNGDNVVAIESWKPPSVWENVSTQNANAALDQIAAGLQDGSKYTSSRRSDDRWVGQVLVKLGLNEAQAAEVIQTWIRNGLLQRTKYYDTAQRKDRAGLEVNDARRPG